MYTLRQAAEMLNVQPKVLRRLLQDGRVPGAVQVAAKHGGETWRVPVEALEAARRMLPRDEGLLQVSAPTAIRLAPPPAVLPAISAVDEPPPLPAEAVSAAAPMTEAEIVARHLTAAAPALNGGQVQAPKDHLVPMTVVVELLRAEAEQRRAAQRMVDDQGHTIAMLRQNIDGDRDEIMRLRAEIAELRQELVQAQKGLLRLQQKPLRSVDQERPTMPLDLETLQAIAAMN